MATLDVTQETAVKPSVLSLADESSMIDEVNSSQYVSFSEIPHPGRLFEESDFLVPTYFLHPVTVSGSMC